MPRITQKAYAFAEKPAIIDPKGEFTYQQIIDASSLWAHRFLNGQTDLNGARIAFMINPGFDYVAVQWGIWKAGGVAVPLCVTYPLASLAYVLDDTAADQVVIDAEFESVLLEHVSAQGLIVHLISKPVNPEIGALPSVSADRPAMILYTSGTTSLPKGVVSTHATIDFQMECLIQAWEWNEADRTICMLPLHHIHGIINVVGCSLSVGGICEFLPKFNESVVFDRLLSGELTVFMAVPTIYFKLISHWDSFSEDKKQFVFDQLKAFRLMVSGSAALPVSVMEKWHVISGHWLLERYGMTEIGMAISNPFHGERKPGHVGIPLPGVHVRLMGDESVIKEDLAPGEIQIKGPNVFQSYWNKAEATADTFTADGWFKTGDVAHVENGYFKILGRSSVDIIKSGGYKLSALEIEEVIRQHPNVADCGVVGLADEEWGEIVAVVVVLTTDMEVNALNTWLRERLPGYKVPRKYLIKEELPRNAMGKVTKNDLKAMFTK
jgi:malonyl-CoA/methylmalonyl-CoA synthetase